jgi:heme a synthase
VSNGTPLPTNSVTTYSENYKSSDLVHFLKDKQLLKFSCTLVMEVSVLIMRFTALIAMILTYLLIVFGGYVASSESGMGCGPEWPLCNGEVLPELKGETLIEFAHRMIGLFLVILTVGLYFTIRKRKPDDALNKAGLWMISLLTIQVLAGAVVVLLDLPSMVVTFHLIVAMLFVYSIIWIFHRGKTNNLQVQYEKQKRILVHVHILFFLVLLTIGLGAYIKHEQYGLACGWLGCQDTMLPTSLPELMQTIHRGVAVLTAAYILILAMIAFIRNWEATVKKRIFIAALIVLFQLGSGILTVKTYISIPWAVIHLAIGTLLFMAISDLRIWLITSINVNHSGSWVTGRGKIIGK